MVIKHKEKILEWLVVVLLLGGVSYAATTAWKNETALTRFGEDVKSIKRSMIDLLLDDNPDKTDIAKKLLGSAQVLQGVQSFNAGNFEAAYQNWEIAAEAGDQDAVYAIRVAKESLREQLANPEISESQKAELKKALETAPDVEMESSVYIQERLRDGQ